MLYPFTIYQTPIILASKSPRRIELMQEMGFQFTVRLAGDINEQYPMHLRGQEIPLYLACLKSDEFLRSDAISDETVLLTADTVVWNNSGALEKPADRQEAIDMLESLSNRMHHVYTGVCLAANHKRHSFYDESRVFFRKLSQEEIIFYIDNFKPYDKAGAYGIQEWIGYVGIEKIEGSYQNVMGLPVQKLYCELCKFILSGE